MSLLVFVALNFLAASSGALFSPGRWYEDLRKPAWRPPNAAFPVVWTVLYILIAIAGWRVWERASPEALPLAMGIYGVQLALNAGWSAIFFGMKRMRLALAELGLLWLSIALMIAVFLPIDGLAALLLVPYLAWVTAAGALNLAMIRLNPELPA
jgi:benzodiazapine receptor